MERCKHKKDKYGCIKGCKDYYPIISRKSIIIETQLAEEREYCECEKRCEKCGKLLGRLD